MDWNELLKDKINVWETPAPILVERAAYWKTNGVKRVADIGCGGGRHTNYLAENGFYVDALDISSSAILRTSEILSKNGSIRNVNLQQMEATHIPLGDNRCEAVLSISAIHHSTIDGIRRILSEIHRILTPGAELLLVVPSIKHPTYGYGTRVECNTFITKKGVDAGIPHHFFESEELKKVLEDASLYPSAISDATAEDIAGINNGHLLAYANAM